MYIRKRNICLALCLVIFIGCNTYVSLQPYQTIVHYFSTSNQFVLIGKPFDTKHTTWKSAYCEPPLANAMITIIELNCSDSVFQKLPVKSDSIFTQMDSDSLFTVYRYDLCQYHNIECTYYTVGSSEIQPVRLVDFFCYERKIIKIKFRFMIT